MAGKPGGRREAASLKWVGGVRLPGREPLILRREGAVSAIFSPSDRSVARS
jgi:hypothetical protein